MDRRFPHRLGHPKRVSRVTASDRKVEVECETEMSEAEREAFVSVVAAASGLVRLGVAGDPRKRLRNSTAPVSGVTSTRELS
jgi:hypothetical protein